MQKILIVDDDKVMLKIATRILSGKYEIICASNAEDALKIFREEKPDLILSDLLMPGTDGCEFCRRIQEDFSETVPIIFMTADDRDESESHGFEIGASDYIRKPVKADILLRRVANVLENADKIHGLERAANIDSMTGLLNKTAIQKELEKICSTGSGTLMMIDLDNFKLVNDFHGHGTGDKILVKFAELMTGVIRATDLAGRIGGDEFIAFCEHVSSEAVIAAKTKFLNKKILEAAKEIVGEEFKIPLGVSVGAVFVPDEGTDFEILYEKADNALYKVKQNGKHGYAIYSEENHEKIFSQDETSDIKKILGERSDAHGAYFLDPDYFKIIYRFAVRLTGNYGREIQFLKITLKNASAGDLGELKNLLIKTLRKSDCITRNGKHEFYILLPETPAHDVEIIKKRIEDNVKKLDTLFGRAIEFYSESLS